MFVAIGVYLVVLDHYDQRQIYLVPTSYLTLASNDRWAAHTK